MTQSGDLLLRNDPLITDAALLTVGQAGLGAGCGVAVDGDGEVTIGSQFLGVAVAADGAGVGHDAGLGAAGLDGDDTFVVVAQGLGLVSGVAVAAGGAGVGGVAALGAGGSGHDGFVAVTQSGDLLLGNNPNQADAALLTVGQAGLGAGCGIAGGLRREVAGGLGHDVGTVGFHAADSAVANGIIIAALGAGVGLFILRNNTTIGVTKSCGLVSSVAVAADRAGIGGVAALGAGGSGHNGLVAVTQSGDLLLRNDPLITDAALLTVGQAGPGAGCGFAGNLHRRVADGLGDDGFPIELRIANGAIHDGIIIAALGAGVGLFILHNNTTTGVTQGLGLVSGVAVAAGAGIGGVAALGAGRSGDNGLVAMLMGGSDVVDVELGNGDPAVAGLLGHELHEADGLCLKVHVLTVAVVLEGCVLGNLDPLGFLGLLDEQAGLGDPAALVANTGSEGEAGDGVSLAEVDDAGESVLAGQLVLGSLPVGVPDGAGVAVPCVLEQALLGVVDGLGVNGDLDPVALAPGIDLVHGLLSDVVDVELGAVATPAADAAGIAQVVAILVGLQALDGPAGTLVVDQLKDMTGLVQGCGVAADVQVAAHILDLEAALNSLQSPDHLVLDLAAAAFGGQSVGAPCIAALRIGQGAHGAGQTNDIAHICFHRSDLLANGLDDFLCVDMTHGHHTDDHDQRQQQAQETHLVVFHLFHTSFRFLLFSPEKCFRAPPLGYGWGRKG